MCSRGIAQAVLPLAGIEVRPGALERRGVAASHRVNVNTVRAGCDAGKGPLQTHAALRCCAQVQRTKLLPGGRTHGRAGPAAPGGGSRRAG